MFDAFSRRFWQDFDLLLASIFDPKIILKKHRTSTNHGFDFRTLEGVSSTSGRGGPAEIARCVKRSRLGAVAWQGLAQRRSASQTRSSHRKRWSPECAAGATPPTTVTAQELEALREGNKGEKTTESVRAPTGGCTAPHVVLPRCWSSTQRQTS